MFAQISEYFVLLFLLIDQFVMRFSLEIADSTVAYASSSLLTAERGAFTSILLRTRSNFNVY